MKIDYARVSTQDQTLDVQIKQLRAIGCEKIYQEQVSGKSGSVANLVRGVTDQP